MRKFSVAAVSAMLIAFGTSAYAAGYGSAGCGWGGNVIHDKKNFWAQLGAWYLNGYSSNQTFAITSGTSNCNTKGLSGQLEEQKAFVENNFQSLVKEMAVGQGEDLHSLAGLLGCSAGVSADFAAFTQAHFTAIYASEETTPSQMLDALKRGVSGDRLLASSCHTL